ncbi:MAG: hypothetical protein ABI591_17625 [Kofleriaceae bacterium]
MRCLYAFAIFAACRGSSSDGPTTDVFALAGEVQPEAGATVLTTGVDGTPIDQGLTGGDGHIVLGYAPGALVTVEYHRGTSTVMITTPALASGTLAVHGPIADQAPIIAGGLTITAVAISADMFVIDLGCTKITTTMFPKTVDVLATCLGTDPNLDVLVTALANGTVVGYSAARVPLVDEVGMFDIPQWTTTNTTIPVTQNDLSATFAIDEVADGLVFPGPTGPTGTTGTGVWTGLTSDQTRVHATVANSTTTQFTAGLPASIAFVAGDFLPPATTHLTRTSSAYAWTAFGIGDLTNLHVAWSSISWDAVLPPDASSISFPDPDRAPPESNVTMTLRAIDGPDTASFADVQAAGLRIQGLTGGTIVPPPTAGEVRETSSI